MTCQLRIDDLSSCDHPKAWGHSSGLRMWEKQTNTRTCKKTLYFRREFFPCRKSLKTLSRKMHQLLMYIYIFIARDHELDHEGIHIGKRFPAYHHVCHFEDFNFFLQGKSKFIDISKFNPIPALSNSNIFF